MGQTGGFTARLEGGRGRERKAPSSLQEKVASKGVAEKSVKLWHRLWSC